MPQYVEVKGYGQVGFPDGMSQQEIAAVLREQFPPEDPRLFSKQPAAPYSSLNDPRGAALTIASAPVAEIAGGLAGIAGGLVGMLAPGGETGTEKANRWLNSTRDFVTIDPPNPASRAVVENIGEFGDAAAQVARAPAAGLTGLASLPQGVDVAAARTRRVMHEGVGPVAGEAVAEITGSPAAGAAVATIPTALLTALGLKGINRMSKSAVEGLTADVARRVEMAGLDPTDTSPQNVARMQEVLTQDTGAQAGRVQAFRDLDMEPTRAQVTRSADDFQFQQETAKRSGHVRQALEGQEGRLAQHFDDAIRDTAGRPNTSGAPIVDEVVGRFTNLDDQINALYRQAREQAGTNDVVPLKGFTEALEGIVPSDRAMQGLPGSIRGNLVLRGVIDKDGNVVRNVDIAEAEEIRAFVNSHFDSTSGQGRRAIRQLKDALDEDVFSASGKDVFETARKAKADFEATLAGEKATKFDARGKSLIRDILENRIDPDQLADRLAFSKGTRASDLKQLRDFLEQTESGRQAFDDLRAQTLQRIRDDSFIGPQDAQGVQALSRHKLQASIDRIGQERLDVLFTAPERRLLNKILKVAELREPVRGTALGRGPSAQAVESLRDALSRSELVSLLIDKILLDRDGRIVLQPTVEPVRVRRATPATGLAVPLTQGAVADD